MSEIVPAAEATSPGAGVGETTSGRVREPAADSDTAPEISTRVVSVFFQYFEHRFGKERTRKALERLGPHPSLEYVLDPENFVSLEYCVRVARVLTDEASDPHFLRAAGLYQFASPAFFGFVYHLARALGTPKLYYRTAVRLSRAYNRVCEMHIEELTDSRMRLRYRSLRPEGTRLMCEGRLGQLAAAPTLWGLPPADARETQCQVAGAEACMYELRWIPSFRPGLRALGGTILGAVVGAVLAHGLGAAGPGAAAIIVSAIMGGLAALALAYRTESARKTRHILDVTEGSEKAIDELRKRFEQVRGLNAETEKSRRSLLGEQRRREKAEAALIEAQKLEAVGRLSGGIAHDFNNILTVILNYADFARADLHSPHDLRDSLDAVSSAARRGAELTGRLLTFARRQIVEPRVFVVEDHLRAVEQMLVRLVGEDIAVELAIGPEPSCVLVDPGQFEQLLLNLAANARDAMPAGGRLRLETSRIVVRDETPTVADNLGPGAYVMLTVTDTGSGMDVETQRRIFEPFFTTKEPGRGTGLGLSSCHGIVRQAHGAIGVHSAPGQGTTFRVYLPRVDRKPDQPPATPSRPRRAPGGHETVLVVEDDDQVRGIAVRALEAAGYHIREARSGAEAIGSGDIDLLVTDVVMPGIDGHELAERLRAIQPRLRVLFLSGYPQDVIARRRIEISRVHFLAKPFAVDDLTRKVREVLDADAPFAEARPQQP